MFGRFARLSVALLTTTWAAGTLAQPLGELPSLEGFAKAKPAGVKNSLVADTTAIVPGKSFRVGVAFDVPSKPETYFYYKTPGTSGLPTRIRLELPAGFQAGPLQFPAPAVKHDATDPEAIYYVYKKSTLIFAEITPPADLAPGDKVEIRAVLDYQFCNDTCTAVRDRQVALSLSIATEAQPSKEAKQFDQSAMQIPSSETEKAVVKATPLLNFDALRPDSKATLALELSIASGYHIQMHQPPDPSLISTEVILDLPDGVSFSAPLFPEPFAPIDPLEGFEHVKEYRETVTVLVPLRAMKSLPLGEAVLRGMVKYQPCNEQGCLAPAYAPFQLTVPVVSKETAVDEQVDGVFASIPKRQEAARTGTAVVPPVPPRADKPLTGSNTSSDPAPTSVPGSELGIGWQLLFAFLGGIILNVMPCVLPVLAIKILGFVSQAHESRLRVLLLNVTYSLGILTVFLILATLTALAGWNWGELFRHPEFNLVMAGVVFAMGLSLLGVFDIPIPGFAGTIDVSKKEGPLGAFLTGILATLLATPCNGPFVAAAIAWSVAQKSPIVVYAIWIMMGLGMATPYLLCGFFPSLVRWLPKPGMWMVRFKQFAGFVLMGTVVFIISYLDGAYILPLLVILLGVAMGLWMISNLYDYSSHIRHKTMVRVLAGAITLGSIALGIVVLKPIAEHRLLESHKQWAADARLLRPTDDFYAKGKIDWVPYTEEIFAHYVSRGRPILLDFTAEWCQICQTNEEYVLDTLPVIEVLRQLDVVPIKVDFTHKSVERDRAADRFGARSLPRYVVIAPNDPETWSYLDGPISQSSIVDLVRSKVPQIADESQSTAQLSMAK